ncbi:hypothetical protein AVEN_96632-1 [Araneus ventricosus]|uniref:DUF5641 domain-containing protein n=1 Tax=Araneus ventricosus TaxID=182803 RepID=A0A4Y2E7E2_ARAVE|nr:hypothetical protein AVEN_96632-1 [Araneus ventricosus]
MNPFLDDNGILRVGGRIENSSVNFDQKHPIVLPDKSNFTKIVILYFHLKNMHLEGIQWKLLAPRAPNFGGLWEAGVKSFKFNFKRVVGVSKLTCEEFYTILHEVEGILNSRPLTPLSSDVDDLEVLTPVHFLIGRPITAIAEPNLTNVENNRLNLWQKTSKMIQIIWKKWQNNYLSTLQQRNKWMIKKQNLKVGDMVSLKEENLPCCKWILGRIVDVFYGKENVVRVINVKTNSGIYKRSISKIALLPLEN